MTNTNSVEQRENLQKVLITTLGKDLQTLDSEIASVLVDDLITAFYNRLKVLKRFQSGQ